jgi:hypothetical protein
MAVSNGIFGGAIANNVIGGTEQYIASDRNTNGVIGYAQQAISQRDYDRMRYEQEREIMERRRYEQMLGQRRFADVALSNPWEEPKKKHEEKPQTDPLGFLKKADTKLLLTQEN